MWRQGEHGPAQQMLLPFPNGQGTDSEIDQWLEQTRAAVHSQRKPGPGPGSRGERGDFGQQTRMLQARALGPSAEGSRAGLRVLRTVHDGVPLPATEEDSGQALGVADTAASHGGSSSIQSLREIVSTSPVRGPARGHAGESRQRLDPLSLDMSLRDGMPKQAQQGRARQADRSPATGHSSRPLRQARMAAAAGVPGSEAGPDAATGAARTEPLRLAGDSPKKRAGSKPRKKAFSPASRARDEPMVKPAAEYADISIFPRRKAGQSGIGTNRPPVVITREVLEEHFNMPLLSVCKKLVSVSPCVLPLFIAPHVLGAWPDYGTCSSEET